MLPKRWEKLLNPGVIIPAKTRFCNECTDKLTCKNCNSQFMEKKSSKLIKIY